MILSQVIFLLLARIATLSDFYSCLPPPPTIFYESRLMAYSFTSCFILLPSPPGLDGQWAAFHLVPTLTFSG